MKQGVPDEQQPEEGQSGRDISGDQAAGDLVEPAEAAEGPEDQQGGERERRVDDFKAGGLTGVGLRLGIALGVEDIGEFLGKLRREGLEIEDRGDEVEFPQGEQGQEDQECDGVPFHVGEVCTGAAGVNSGYWKDGEFHLDPAEKRQDEFIFLPAEIVRSIGNDPADWEDPAWD